MLRIWQILEDLSNGRVDNRLGLVLGLGIVALVVFFVSVHVAAPFSKGARVLALVCWMWIGLGLMVWLHIALAMFLISMVGFYYPALIFPAVIAVCFACYGLFGAWFAVGEWVHKKVKSRRSLTSSAQIVK